MKLKVKYKWALQPNKKITVFQVPIFKAFSDKERGEVSRDNLREVVRRFQEDRENGYYPRLHLQHQDPNTTENAPGVGYIENLQLKGDTIYADFVEIPRSIFERMKERELPACSVEYDMNRNQIASVALLESRAPYFHFPLIALEERPVKLSNAEEYMFSLREKILYFQENDMIFTKSKPKKSVMMESEAGETGFATLDNKLNEILEKVSYLYDIITEEEEEGEPEEEEETEGEEEGEEEVPEGEEEEEGAESSSVAMQAQVAQIFQALKGEFTKLNSRLNKIEKTSQKSELTQEIQALCEANPTLNFETVTSQVNKFSTLKDKKNFLNILSKSESFESGGVENYAQLPARFDNLTEKFAQKYHDAPQSVQLVAKRATKDWYETVNQRNRRRAQQFQSLWPDIEQFVDFHCEMEAQNPGHYDKFVKGE